MKLLNTSVSSDFANILWRECGDALLQHNFKATPQDMRLLQQVVGPAGSTHGYLYGGFTTSIGIRAFLRHLGTDLLHFRNILDFGCGSGRLTRWFKDVAATGQVSGTDINAHAIDWCRQNIEWATFTHNNARPPLAFPAGSFDLITGISVFTHLDEELQLEWLAELDRVSKPGAVLLLTVHGEDKARNDLPEDEFQGFRSHGHFYQRAREWRTVDGLPDFYQVAFHSRNYIESVWTRYFDILGYLQYGPMYSQQLVAVRKRGSEPAVNPVCDIVLPVASLEFPRAGTKVNLDSIGMTGWAVGKGQNLRLRLWIDDREVAVTTANQERPDVLRAFPTYAGAQFSGFSEKVSIQFLMAGPHMAWISLENDSFPLCATFFWRDSRSTRLIQDDARRRLGLR